MRIGNVAADDDDMRVQSVHEGGEDLSQVPAGLADDLYGVRVVIAGEADDITTVCDIVAPRVELAGESSTAGHGFDATRVSAFADDVSVVGQADVSDIPRRALGTPVDRAIDDDAAPDPRADLDEQQMLAG